MGKLTNTSTMSLCLDKLSVAFFTDLSQAFSEVAPISTCRFLPTPSSSCILCVPLPCLFASLCAFAHSNSITYLVHSTTFFLFHIFLIDFFKIPCFFPLSQCGCIHHAHLNLELSKTPRLVPTNTKAGLSILSCL